MGVLDIREYIWNVFEIATYHDTSTIKYALDMFLTNIELGIERYEGASGVNYINLHKRWNHMTKRDKEFQKIIFNKIIRYSYLALYDAWINDNILSFSNITRMTNICDLGLSQVNPESIKLEKRKISPIKKHRKHRKRRYKQF